MVYGLWFMVHGSWFMVYGLWCMVYGLWSMVYGVWCKPLTVNPKPRQARRNVLCGRAGPPRASRVQGYLAHKKAPPSLGPPYSPRHRPTVG
ncbi:hypothetical protein T484DRAFT_2378551 [Baffinella frigidus]|nr:hypothetical protein T484DRAFT_2378551 [Cryptophyta sp. CCMP2293]